MADEGHPTVVELGRWVDGQLEAADAARLEAHHSRCLACRRAVNYDHGPIPAPNDEQVRALTSSAQLVPEGMLTAVHHRRGGTPGSGQLWRLEYEGEVGLALILEPLGEGLTAPVLIAPVTADPEFADQYTLRIDAEATPLELPLAVWSALRTRVPRFVLDLQLAEFDVVKHVDELHRHYLADTAYDPNAEHLSVGLAIVSPADPRWEYRESVVELFTRLGEADELHAEAAEGEALTGPLGDLVAERGLSARVIAAALRLDAPAIHALLSGAREASDAEAAVLADLLDVDSAEIFARRPRVPRDLRLAWYTPDTRQRTADAAAAASVPVTNVRVAGTQHLLLQAARLTGSETAGVQAWERQIHAWLDTQA